MSSKTKAVNIRKQCGLLTLRSFRYSRQVFAETLLQQNSFLCCQLESYTHTVVTLDAFTANRRCPRRRHRSADARNWST